MVSKRVLLLQNELISNLILKHKCAISKERYLEIICHSLGFDVSVNIRVPEQSLVTIAPEEFLLPDVLVVVLSGPLFIWDFSQMLSVFSMVQFNLTNWDGSQKNNRESNNVRYFFPHIGDTLGVFRLFLGSFLESFTSLLVNLYTGESSIVNKLRYVTMTMAVGVEPHKVTLCQFPKHFNCISREALCC